MELRVLFFFFVTGVFASPKSNGPTVCVDTGCLVGLTRRTDRVFYNIPYVKPPVGSLRFAPPQLPLPWKGTRDATTKGPYCIQNGRGADIGKYSAEDCLQLNVYVPATAGRIPLPVAVWIHGGGYEAGDGVDFDPVLLMAATPGKYIVVTLNYRLSIFGFLGSDAMRSRDPQGGSTGNFGIQDQRAALQWVQRNIHAFGGNKDAVTIFGESAGAGSVSNHLAMPRSEGLYTQAIMESGSFSPWAAKPMWHAELVFQRTLNLTRCASVACLVAMDAAKLTDAVAAITLSDGHTPMGEVSYGSLALGVFSCPWAPTIDGVELKAHPLTLARAGKLNPSAGILHGINRDEGAMFTHSFPSSATTAALDKYWVAVFGKNNATTLSHYYSNQTYPAVPLVSKQYFMGMRAASDLMFGCTAREISSLLSASGKVYNYMFSFEDGGKAILIPHAEELKYIWGCCPMLADANQRAMSLELRTRWSNFFISGVPTATDTGVTWPTFDAVSSGATLAMNQPTGVVVHGLKSDICDDFMIPFIHHKINEGPPPRPHFPTPQL